MAKVMECAKKQSWERRALNGLLRGFHGRGLDVGAGVDPFHWWEMPELIDHRLRVDTWDREQGDAHLLEGVPDQYYDFLFASHVLEHLEKPDVALYSWVRVVRPGGALLIAVPHQHLYERKASLPSRWNPNHVRFYTPTSLRQWLQEMKSYAPFELVALQTGDWDWEPRSPNQHAIGEYQIDALLRKL